MEGSRKERVTSQQRLGFWVMGGGVVGGGHLCPGPQDRNSPGGQGRNLLVQRFPIVPQRAGGQRGVPHALFDPSVLLCSAA